jgi:hypothetical protein
MVVKEAKAAVVLPRAQAWAARRASPVGFGVDGWLVDAPQTP